MAKQKLLDLRNRTKYPKGAESYKATLSPEELKLLDDYLEYRSITFNPNKLLDVQRAILNFRYVVDRSLTDNFTLNDVKQFLKVLYHSDRSDETKKSTGEYLFMSRRAFLRWRFKDWSIRFNDFVDESGFPIARWRTRPLADRLTENDLLTEDDVRRMWASCSRLRDRALIALHGATPARTKEIRDLRWRDVLLSEKRIRVHDTKTGRSREMPFDDIACRFLIEWHRNYHVGDSRSKTKGSIGMPLPHWHVFPSSSSPEEPVPKSYVSRTFKRAAKQAGLTKNVYGYLNRHSAISRYQKQGVDIRDVANVAGHSSIATTLGYTHLNKSHSINQVVAKVFQKQQAPPSSDSQGTPNQEIAMLNRQLQQVMTYLRDSGQPTQNEICLPTTTRRTDASNNWTR
ncbi:phage integrase family protein [Planctomycetales bacterium ZRK34]|nr:phage integrase family protein [Planctomycetales bacterium ZRK34]